MFSAGQSGCAAAKTTFGRLATVGLALSLVLPFVVGLSGGAALAGSAVAGFPCGRITAFTAPTATSAGSIRIGTTTFVAAPGSLPNPAPPLDIGSVVCLTGALDANGAFVSLTASTLGEQAVCGRVAAFSPPSGAAPGSLTLVTNATWVLPVRAGAATPAQTSAVQCFKFEINAQGNTEAISFLGPPAGGTQLPSTTTEQGSPTPALTLALIGAALVGAGALWRMRARSR